MRFARRTIRRRPRSWMRATALACWFSMNRSTCGQAHKVKFDYGSDFDEWWKQDISSMVLRDRNHPSIVIWGIGNEIPELEVDRGTALGKAACRPGAMRSTTTRPLTAGVSRHNHEAHRRRPYSRNSTLPATTTTYSPPTRRIMTSCQPA